jgi:hypothetical protein
VVVGVSFSVVVTVKDLGLFFLGLSLSLNNWSYFIYVQLGKKKEKERVVHSTLVSRENFSVPPHLFVRHRRVWSAVAAAAAYCLLVPLAFCFTFLVLLSFCWLFPPLNF